jgi:hypothetical protein
MVLAQKQQRISFLDTRLLHYILERARWHLIGRVTRNGHCTRFRRVMKLAVTALLPDLSPLILLNQANRIPDFHCTSLSGPLRRYLESDRSAFG